LHKAITNAAKTLINQSLQDFSSNWLTDLKKKFYGWLSGSTDF